MTEVSTIPAAGGLATPALTAPDSQTVVDLQVWASELSAAMQLGKALASTDFVPASLKTLSGGRPKEPQQIAENVAATILAGKSLGLDPMNSIQNIFVVQGRPAMYARTMVALVLSAGHDLRRSVATPEAVTVMARRKGQADWQEFTWTIDRARQAGYLSNKKYSTDPTAMLTAKAQAEACRTIAPDVLTGVAAYSVEEVELEDMGEAPAPAAAAPAAAPKARAKVQRRQAPAPELPPVVHDAPPVAVEPDPEPEGMASPEQITHLIVALKAAGHTTNEAKAAAVQEQVGRTLGGFQDLTSDEAAGLTEYFTAEGPQAAPAEDAAAADAAWLAGAN